MTIRRSWVVNILSRVLDHRTLALIRWDLVLFLGRLRYGIRNDWKAAERGRAKSAKYLNLGSGSRGLDDPDWLNVDALMNRNVHLCMDFTKRFPFPQKRIDGIFCEHVLEHFRLDTVENILRECHSTVRPGGSIRIVVPDLGCFQSLRAGA